MTTTSNDAPIPSTSPGRRRRRALVLAVAVALSWTSTGCGLADALGREASCTPNDPVVSPTSVAPGDEVHVEVDGVGQHPECSSTLSKGVRYGISVRSLVEGTGNTDDGRLYYRADLGYLDPSSDGVADGTVRLPDDVPAGGARISVDINVPTPCEVDPAASCGPHPSAVVDIVG